MHLVVVFIYALPVIGFHHTRLSTVMATIVHYYVFKKSMWQLVNLSSTTTMTRLVTALQWWERTVFCTQCSRSQTYLKKAIKEAQPIKLQHIGAADLTVWHCKQLTLLSTQIYRKTKTFARTTTIRQSSLEWSPIEIPHRTRGLICNGKDRTMWQHMMQWGIFSMSFPKCMMTRLSELARWTSLYELFLADSSYLQTGTNLLGCWLSHAVGLQRIWSFKRWRMKSGRAVLCFADHYCPPILPWFTLLTTDLTIAHEVIHDSIGVSLQKTGFNGSIPCRKSESCKNGRRCSEQGG